MSACILGDGYNLNGYRARKKAGKIRYLHRVAWEEKNGPIAEGLFIDHTCKNRACVNVAHLRLVPPRINSIENSDGATARNAAKTHCVRGHKLPSERDGRGQRICKECKRVVNRAIAQRERATAVLFGG